jgi:hypothetical protein
MLDGEEGGWWWWWMVMTMVVVRKVKEGRKEGRKNVYTIIYVYRI